MHDVLELARSAPRSARARRRPRPVTPSSGIRKRIAPSSSYALPSASSCCASSRQRSIASSWKRDRPVPVDPEPLQRALDLLGRLGDLAARVGVLDPQQALAALVAAGEEPVEEERAHPADVEEPGRARGHADANAHAGSVDGSRRAADRPHGRDQQHARVQHEDRAGREPEGVRDADPGGDESGEHEPERRQHERAERVVRAHPRLRVLGHLALEDREPERQVDGDPEARRRTTQPRSPRSARAARARRAGS